MLEAHPDEEAICAHDARDVMEPSALVGRSEIEPDDEESGSEEGKAEIGNL